MKLNKIAQLQASIGCLEAQISAIQDTCSHPALAVEKTHRRGGEFDLEYTTDFDCGLCGKFWTQEGSR